MEHLRKKEWIKIDSIWRRTFLVEVKEETGYYTKAADGRADWVVLAWVKNDVLVFHSSCTGNFHAFH